QYVFYALMTLAGALVGIGIGLLIRYAIYKRIERDRAPLLPQAAYGAQPPPPHAPNTPVMVPVARTLPYGRVQYEMDPIGPQQMADQQKIATDQVKK
ncbi:hypothetical protein PENTCL1PPCAC_5260, partial [Pristionchus entomophagus]